MRQQLRKLSLHTMAAIFEEEAEKAAKSQMSYTAFLARLADEEVAAKTEGSINAKVAKARFWAARGRSNQHRPLQASPGRSRPRIRSGKG